MGKRFITNNTMLQVVARSACLLITFVMIATSAPAQMVVTGVVTEVIDGNTLRVALVETDTVIIVLSGVDCPEPGQEFAAEATAFTRDWFHDQAVRIYREGKDRYGRDVAVVQLSNGADVRVALVENGLAWTAERHPSPALESLRLKAQGAGTGLWQTRQPVPPWTYRRQQSMLTPKSQ